MANPYNPFGAPKGSAVASGGSGNASGSGGGSPNTWQQITGQVPGGAGLLSSQQLSGFEQGEQYQGQGQGFYNQFAQQALGNAAPQAVNPYAQGDLANQRGVLGGYSSLTGPGGYYAKQLNGTGPSLAAMQAQQAAQQSIAAEQSAANSARGPLAGALAARTAAMGQQQALLAAAQQSVQGRIAEQQAAAQGLGNALQGQGQYGLGVQGLNQNFAMGNANLQAGQNALNQQGALGYLGLGQQASANQMTGGANAAQTAISAAGQSQQLAEFNAQNNANAYQKLLGGVINGVGGWLSQGGGSAPGSPPDNPLANTQPNGSENNGGVIVQGGGSSSGGGDTSGGSGSGDNSSSGGSGDNTGSDVKLREPGGGSKYTIREEPFGLLLRNDSTGSLSKIATQPLSDDEHRQAMAPHGAGPLIGATPPPVRDPKTGYLWASDLDFGDIGDVAGDIGGATDAASAATSAASSAGDDASLMSQMQAAAGPADAYGNYTPAAAIPGGGVASAAGGMMPSSGPNWAKLGGKALSGFGQSMAPAPRAAPAQSGPSNITGMPSYADPGSYGVQKSPQQQSQGNAAGDFMKSVGMIASIAAMAL